MSLTGNNRSANRYPEGIIENSPAFQRRDAVVCSHSPEGTAESRRSGHGIRPSLRDLCRLLSERGVETPGYSHLSLRDKGRTAFTLIELIVVMALLLIVVGVSFPSLKNFFKGRTLDSEARRFLSLTRYGHSRAVSEGVPMVLWVDVRGGTYGLQAQASYLATDTKAIDYELDKDLQMEVSTPPATALLMPGTTAAAAANLPHIRFTPDGFISETSPETIQIREGRDRNNPAIWITQNANRLNYEIQTSQPTPRRR
jgi:prepilin-type N-terminal cleavage/methylation domain-containing protein